MNRLLSTVAIGLVLVLTASSAPLRAQDRTASDILVPYFEVDLGAGGRTTRFSVVNSSHDTVRLVATVASNWGTRVVATSTVLGPSAVLTVDLHRWLVDGVLLDRTLSKADLEHVQAALCGQRSPRDGKFYGSEVVLDRMVGTVALRLQGTARPDALFGDYFIEDQTDLFDQGELLVVIDTGVVRDRCRRQAIRFRESDELGYTTEILLWTRRNIDAQASRDYPAARLVRYTAEVYDDSGRLVSTCHPALLPVALLPMCDVVKTVARGWIVISTNEEFFVTGHFTSPTEGTNALHAVCVPTESAGPGGSITLEKLIESDPADTPPGPRLTFGQTVHFDFLVTNTGKTILSGIEVTDDTGLQPICPKAVLDPGESMTCTATATAQRCSHKDIGTVVAASAEGPLSASDPAHYFVAPGSAIALEGRVNGMNADEPPGVLVAVGATLAWTYDVTNTGEVTLTEVAVSDTLGMTITCPKTTLAPGETMTCTASSTAEAGEHTSHASAGGRGPCGPVVTDDDDTVYTAGNAPAITLVKRTNGEDANEPTGPRVNFGTTIEWTYAVANAGPVTLTAVHVTDDQGVVVTCPKTVLQSGESMTCTASGIAVLGQYANVGTAFGTPPTGPQVSASDPSHYFGERGELHNPAIDIEKLTNGEDADTAPGPAITVGGAVHWTYVVTNTGDLVLNAVTVTDSKGVAVTCPKTVLQIGETMTCTANGVAVLGDYENVGTAVGSPPDGDPVSDTDPSHYHGVAPPNPKIAIVKKTNGEDANLPPGPRIAAGAAITWTYLVTNIGDVRLTSVAVTDSKGVAVTCPKTVLEPGESMTCTASGVATPPSTFSPAEPFEQPDQVLPTCEERTWLYENVGTATGLPPSGPQVSASDPSHYTGYVPAEEGCTPGYWKNHTGSWPPTGYSTTQEVDTVFGGATAYPTLGNATLLQALSFDGGTGLSGAAEILLRAGVAALLNASHPSVAYPLAAADVISSVNSALGSANRDTMLNLASQLDADNNLGCPLN